MVKVVINTSVGGFCVSRATYERLGAPWNRCREEEDHDEPPLLLYIYDPELRAAPALVAAVEELGGEMAGDDGTVLGIVEIPDDVQWHIHEFEDGTECVAENHRTWLWEPPDPEP